MTEELYPVAFGLPATVPRKWIRVVGGLGGRRFGCLAIRVNGGLDGWWFGWLVVSVVGGFHWGPEQGKILFHDFRWF